MRHTLLAVVVSIFLYGGTAFAQFGPPAKEAKKDGWWLKIDAKESKMIGFYVGADSHSYGFWTVWNPGSPTEFDISDEFRTSPTLYILAQTTSGAKCSFCIMYKDKGVKRFEFDLEEDHEVNPSQEDKRCR
jgi:hypothetical protein